MKVLSLFDGMSCGQIALSKLGVKVNKYYASEIDKYAIQITQKNFPNTIQLGDVCNINPKDFMDVDLILAGSPCQGFSFAGKQLAFDDPRSALFFEFVRLLKQIRPKYFLLENVRMKKEFLEVITEQVSACYTVNNVAPEYKDMFGNVRFEPHFINSSLLSAQSRQRYYWTNIPNIKQPEDKGILLRDILEDDAEEPMLSNIYGGFGEKKPRTHTDKSVTIRTASGGGHIPSVKLKNKEEFDKNLDKMTNKEGKAHCLTARYTGAVAWNSIERKQRTMVPTKPKQVGKVKDGGQVNRIYSQDGKSSTLSSQSGGTAGSSNLLIETPEKSQTIKSQYYKSSRANFERQGTFHATGIQNEDLTWRKLTCRECERLQTVPDGYTEGVSDTQRYRMLGNGWTVDVIAHILTNMEK